MTFAVRSYHPGDEEQILALFTKVFGIPRSLDHWRWKFAANPAGRQVSLAVADDGRIVGQYAALPAAAVSPHGPFTLTQGIDHMVDPEFQKRGVFAALARHFAEAHLGPSSDAHYYSYPLAEKHAIDERIGGAEIVHRVGALGWDLTRAEPWRPTWRSGALRVRVRRVARCPAAVDELWARTRPELGVAVRRDRRYLDWRYADCPDVDYSILVAESRLGGRLLGLAVLRFGWFDQPIATVVDLLVPSAERAALAALLAACHERARARGLAAVKLWMPPGTALHGALRELGYTVEETPFLLNIRTGWHPERDALLRAGWYYTMGDSDIY